MRKSILSVLFVLASVRLASSCVCLGTGTPCSEFRSSKVAFVGKVIVDSGEGYGKGPARVMVQEVFHGLPKDVREVEVNTDFLTSCYMRLRLGEQYLLLASPIEGHPDRLHVNTCSFSFRVGGNELLLDALRRMEMGGSPSLIGKVQTMTSRYSTKEGPVGLQVIAYSGINRLTTTTVQGGEFAFLNVPSGTYTLHVESDQYLEEKDAFGPHEPLRVDGNYCEFGELYVWPAGQIIGRITDHLGVAIKGIKVQAFLFGKNEKLDTSALKEALTDEDGNYTLLGMPPGEFAVAVNGEEYHDSLPYRPTFYSWAHRREDATHILLSEGERKQDINIQLPPARKPAILNLLVGLANGTPVEGVSANILDTSGVARFSSKNASDTKGILSLQVYLGETYEVEAFKAEIQHMEERSAPLLLWKGRAGPLFMDAPEKTLRVIVAVENKD